LGNRATTVFISHSSEDKDFARKLTRDLAAHGIRPWLDEAEILPGDSIVQEISQGIDQADYLLVILSPASVNSTWVNHEVGLAFAKNPTGAKRVIVPVLIEHVDIPPFLRDIAYVDMSRGSYQEGLDRIVRAIQRVPDEKTPRPGRLLDPGNLAKEIAKELAKIMTIDSRGIRIESGPAAQDPKRSVFVVHGRDEKLRAAMFSFLRAINLSPIEFSEAVKLTRKASPYIGDILDAAFRNAHAVVVLLSPDDEARLKVEFQKTGDPPHDRELTPQPRQNVLFEAGLAFGCKPDRTILVKVGELRPFSDIYGRLEVRLTNEAERRLELAGRLKDAGCDVNINGTDWLKVGNFEVGAKASPTSLEAAKKLSKQPPQKIEPFPAVLAQIQQRNFKLPRVGFALSNLNKFPLKVRVTATVYLGAKKLGIVPPDPHGYYSGKKEWNVNAENAIFGNFSVHPECANSSETLRIELRVTVADPQGKAYELLPVSYTYDRENRDWYLEPVSVDHLTNEEQSDGT
jgi:predicted nucleotide-binding protein